MDSKTLVDKITAILSAKKAVDIEIIDIQDMTVVADYFVIASARSTTAVKALAGYVEEDMKKNEGVAPLRSEGISASKWIAIDYGDVVVHIFLEETRNFYHLDRLWTNGANITKIEEN